MVLRVLTWCIGGEEVVGERGGACCCDNLSCLGVVGMHVDLGINTNTSFKVCNQRYQSVSENTLQELIPYSVQSVAQVVG